MPVGRKDLAIVRRALEVFATVGILTWGDWASACPNCAVGQRARTLFWTDGFVANALVVLVPFLVIAAVSVRADAIGRHRASSSTNPLLDKTESLP